MTDFDYGLYMDNELMTWARGIINDPDPNTDHVMFDEFICDSGDGDGTIADPDEDDSWSEAE